MTHTGRMMAWTGAAWVPVLVDSTGKLVLDQAIGGGGAGFTDAFNVGIRAADSSVVPTDLSTFAMTLLLSETANVVPTDLPSLRFPAGNFGDSSSVPTDVSASLIRAWAAGCVDNDSSQTVPTRVNGASDAVRAAVKTNNALGDLTNPVVLTTGAFTACPTSGSFTSKTLRVWFNIPAGNTGTADTITIVRNTTATGDVTLFTAGAVAVDQNSGTFTADISALSLADLQTLTVRFSYQAAVVAASLTVLNVDACAVDLAGGL